MIFNVRRLRRLTQKEEDDSRKGAKAPSIMTENEIGKIVVDAAIAVHRALGPGLLETVYEIVLAHELSRRGLHIDRQVPVSIEYDGIRFDEGFRADMIVENKVILEVKHGITRAVNNLQE